MFCEETDVLHYRGLYLKCLHTAGRIQASLFIICGVVYGFLLFHLKAKFASKE